ncbi:RsfA family transcriptional regulator [Bacillus sp. BHET2]|uniref:RsfA family transcriptional regulator n=1 Tax=Bacillus sp. BHET2 TaxID=2583818 RepID=UPI00110EB8F9|nr:RsfA family transcriptional regulator [Bacillus sp. BHET2]TMU84137.1 RsfA family transcriptional regulator [Bacillus sp. BHET2]
MKTRQDAWTEENDLLLAETVLRHVREGSTQLNAFEEVGDKLNRTSAACGFRWNAVVRHQYEKALQLAKKQRKQRHRILGKDQGGKKKLLYQPPTPSFEDLDAMSLSMSEAEEEMEFAEYENYVPETEQLGKDAIDSPNNFEVEAAEEQIYIPQQAPVADHVLKPSGLKGEVTLEKVIAYLQNLAQTNLNSDYTKIENQRLKQEMTDIRKENAELKKKVSALENNSVTMQEDYETLMQIMNRARKLVLFDEDDAKAPRFKMDRNGNLEKVAE